MCGICGIVSSASLADADKSAVRRMNAALLHRGPDGGGEHVDVEAMLAMRRLSIIDLEGGWQPFYNEDQSLALVVNGEIYNHPEFRRDLKARGHRFRTGSDCEVILHLYEERGVECVHELRGMFAFAIWDARKRRMVLGRDRMGEKPLYIYETGRTLIFASELQALVASGRVPVTPDPVSVDRYFHYGFVPEPATALAGVRKLAAAHVMTIDVDAWNISTTRYWDMKDSPPIDGDPVECTRAALDDVFKGVARADTPVGVALSGGIDSSAIAALCVRNGLNVSTFSVGYSGRPRSDERHQASAFADRLGIPFHDVELNVDDMIAQFPDIVAWRDDPIADIAGYGYFAVSRLARDNGVPVMMQGQGADELFWGYDWTVKAVAESEAKESGRAPGVHGLFEEIGEAFPLSLDRADIARFVRNGAGIGAAAARGQRHRQMPPERMVFYDLTAGYQTFEQSRESLLSEAILSKVNASSAARPFTVTLPWGNIEIRITDLLCGTYLRENGIAQGDRLSMRSSVEMRLPFVDYRLVETVIGLRKSGSDSRNGLKRTLRDALRDVLPEEILNRRKRGFAPPATEWQTALLAAYGDSLADGTLVAKDILTSKAARDLAGARPGIGYKSLIAFRALILEQWFERLSMATLARDQSEQPGGSTHG
ncbi:MAG: asparagine synthase (glutamine-hydrolyzing) [Alphaproteobacteria bacterium]|nr:asparagine synthase (glutamine-hydrolyzing) [Alphaproteobacteria bacterium]